MGTNKQQVDVKIEPEVLILSNEKNEIESKIISKYLSLGYNKVYHIFLAFKVMLSYSCRLSIFFLFSP